MDTKQCAKCREIKPISVFNKRGNKVGSYCPDCRKAIQKGRYGEKRAWLEKNRDRLLVYRRTSMLKRKYGLSLADYQNLLKKQDSKCAICDTEDPGSQSGVFPVDHDHHTGKVRGLLCQRCNLALGMLDDSVEFAESLVKYLRQN